MNKARNLLSISGAVFNSSTLSTLGELTNRKNIVTATNALLSITPTWDSVSNNRIKDLNPKLQRAANLLINNDEVRGRFMRVSDGYRSIAAQDALYAKGRTVEGGIVTYAKGGDSYHNYRRAIDLVEISNGDLNYSADIRATAKFSERMGMEWGGRWDGKNKDIPHFQMTDGLSITDLKKTCAE